MRTKFWILPVGVATLSLAAVAFFYSTLSVAAPGVIWTPGSIAKEIGTEQPLSITTSFKATENLQGVTLRVVPEIASLVQVSPQSIASVTKGQSVTVTVTLSAPPSTPLGTKSGTVHLIIGTATVSRPLPVSVTYRGNLPPDSGEAGKATVEGIDLNGNDVRDDLERYIAFNYPNSARTRAALMQAAAALEGQLRARNSEVDSIVAAGRVTASNECLDYVDPANGLDSGAALSAQFLNTRLRIEALKAYEAHLWGKMFRGTSDEALRATCAFNVEALPN